MTKHTKTSYKICKYDTLTRFIACFIIIFELSMLAYW